MCRGSSFIATVRCSRVSRARKHCRHAADADLFKNVGKSKRNALQVRAAAHLPFWAQQWLTVTCSQMPVSRWLAASLWMWARSGSTSRRSSASPLTIFSITTTARLSPPREPVKNAFDFAPALSFSSISFFFFFVFARSRRSHALATTSLQPCR